MINPCQTILALACSLSTSQADNYYTTEQIPLPGGKIVEVGSIALLPGQKVAITSRRGEAWIGTGLYDEDLTKVSWKLFAEGLHEPFGAYWKDGSLYLTQRGELTRLTDTDNDGEADRYETVCDDWGINGDYHEFAFGSTPDKNGDTWIALCLTGSGAANSDWRGWAVRVTPEGEMIPTCSGIRSPGGIGFNAQGDAFFMDNQGFWNGSSSLKWLKPGGFMGNPKGNIFYAMTDWPPLKEPMNHSRIVTERERLGETFIPPAVIFPHTRIGQSPTGIITDLSAGAFGPFAGQLLVGEHSFSEVQRVDLEMVNGIYQGAVFNFLEGYSSGVVPLRLDTDGTLFVGGTNRGWGSRGAQPFALERTRWNGKTPFEFLTMKVTPDGFRLTFTQPVDKTVATKPQTYKMSAWTYVYQDSYGSSEVDKVTPKVTLASVSEDGLRVDLKVEGRVKGHVHFLEANGLKSASGKSLVHPEAYYTLNEFPK